MRVVCVGRHQYLSEHLGRFFESLGLDCITCVGLDEATTMVASYDPEAVICEYDLLATMSLGVWESDPVLGSVPVIAVSLTRRPGEGHLIDLNEIAGFLYLPTLDPEDAHRVLGAVQRKRAGINPPTVLPWPGTTQTTHLR